MIRELEKGKQEAIPIIAMTANDVKEDWQKAEDAGMNGYLSKPIDVDKITEVLKKMLATG
jgi:CheY-like chemotaxis protein